eukprot:g2763.t1
MANLSVEVAEERERCERLEEGLNTKFQKLEEAAQRQSQAQAQRLQELHEDQLLLLQNRVSSRRFTIWCVP